MSTNNTSNDDFIQVNYTGQQINDAIGAALDAHGIPQGGTAGQVLQKASGTDFDVEWAAQSGGEVDQTYNPLSENAQSGTAVADAISGKENTSNKVTSISAQSTDTQYPSAKCVYDGLGTKQNKLTAGDNITIVNNVISASGSTKPWKLITDTTLAETVGLVTLDQFNDGTNLDCTELFIVSNILINTTSSYGIRFGIYDGTNFGLIHAHLGSEVSAGNNTETVTADVRFCAKIEIIPESGTGLLVGTNLLSVLRPFVTDVVCNGYASTVPSNNIEKITKLQISGAGNYALYQTSWFKIYGR